MKMTSEQNSNFNSQVQQDSVEAECLLKQCLQPAEMKNTEDLLNQFQELGKKNISERKKKQTERHRRPGIKVEK